VAPDPEGRALLEAVDRINRRFGSRAVVFGAMWVPKQLAAVEDAKGEQPVWGMRRERMSPHYTTRWEELVEAQA
jgi:DNA polymerase V